MRLLVNGEERVFDVDKITVADLLKTENVKNPDVVVVQVNGLFCDKDKYSSTLLSDGDQIEFIYFVGGGDGYYH